MDNRPIGVFDSGVGGLTVVNALLHDIPGEDIYYVGDTARVPYGNKSSNLIKQYSEEIVKWLIKKDCKMIIVACNTASALAVDYLKKKYSIPIIGVIDPGVEHAIKMTKSFSIGVLGTNATIQSDSYGSRLKLINPNLNILSQACPLFVPLVEEGLISGEIPRLIAKSYIGHFNNTDIDTIILGCTHYPILKKTISSILNNKIKLVDSGNAISNVVLKSLYKDNLLSDRTSGKIHSFITDSKNTFEKLIKKSLNNAFNIKINSINRIELS